MRRIGRRCGAPRLGGPHVASQTTRQCAPPPFSTCMTHKCDLQRTVIGLGLIGTDAKG